MSRIFTLAATLLAAGLISTGMAWAHGVSWEPADTSPALAFKCQYSSGDPIAYGEVLIYSPKDSEIEHQNGRTDRNGYFSFLPDAPGIWKVEVNGGQGHKVMFDLEVSGPQGENTTTAKQNKNLPHTPVYLRAILGVSLLFNFALAILNLTARKKSKAS